MQEGEELGPRTMRNHMGQSDDQEVEHGKYFDGLMHAGHYYPLPLLLPQDLNRPIKEQTPLEKRRSSSEADGTRTRNHRIDSPVL